VGTGKTTVAQSIKQKIIEEDNGFFATWKFDQESQIEAGDGFAAAFTSLARQILAAGNDVLKKIRQSIQAAGAADSTAIILEMIPMMEPVIGSVERNSKSNGIEALGRQLEIMKAFVRLISTKERPLDFVFGDVQFYDSCTQMLLDGLISDIKNDSFLCIAIVGPEEPKAAVGKLLESFQETCIPTTTIKLADLDALTTNLMVADILHVDEEASAPMTNFLYQYAKGNP
jgi:predicted ATPase